MPDDNRKPAPPKPPLVPTKKTSRGLVIPVIPASWRETTAEHIGTVMAIVGAPRPPRYSAAEREIITALTKNFGRELTQQEITLSHGDRRGDGCGEGDEAGEIDAHIIL